MYLGWSGSRRRDPRAGGFHGELGRTAASAAVMWRSFSASRRPRCWRRICGSSTTSSPGSRTANAPEAAGTGRTRSLSPCWTTMSQYIHDNADDERSRVTTAGDPAALRPLRGHTADRAHCEGETPSRQFAIEADAYRLAGHEVLGQEHEVI